MRVNEIFYSLQGEGFFTGTPAVFLRFSGCNLACDFCDTDHNEGRTMGYAEIIEAVSAYPSRHIVITGGEPSLQLDPVLTGMLHDAGFFIQVETNGTRLLPEDVDWITCSPKDKSVTTVGDSRVVLKRIDEIKIVYIGQDVDAFAMSLPPASHYFLQPCSGANIPATVQYVLAHPHWQLSLQTHKLIDIQ